MGIEQIDNIIGEKNESIQNNTINNNEYLDDFLAESKEHLDNVERSLLSYDKSRDDLTILNSIFRDFHTIKGLSGFVSQGLIQKIAHHTETFLDKCRKGEEAVSDLIISDIFNSADYIKRICDHLELNDDMVFLSEITNFLDSFGKKTIQEQYLDGNRIEYVQDQSNTDTDTEDMDNVVDNIIENAKIKTKSITSISKEAKTESTNVRIPIKKVENLVDLVGEILTSYSQLEEELLQNSASKKTVAMLKKLSIQTKEIQETAISMRLVSFKLLFQRLERIGRDTINELNKNAHIRFIGEETEIDRSIVELLLEPLLHLIKNSVYHGIESEEERKANKKEPFGNIWISAFNRKGFVYIEVSDDGRGIDTEKILQTTIDKNLVDPFVDYSNNEVLNFIFLPGFSTIEKVDKISGRGVGLDVVKTQITKIGGKVEIANSPGQGCCFTMKLPINLSVLNGTIVQISSSQFILPTSSINSIFKPNEEDFVSVKGSSSFVKFKEKIIPIVDVKNHLSIGGYDKLTNIFIILEANHGFYAFPVDKIIDRRDVIVKSLGSEFDKLDYAFGASILGNGKISIILDIEKMLSGRGNEL